MTPKPFELVIRKGSTQPLIYLGDSTTHLYDIVANPHLRGVDSVTGLAVVAAQVSGSTRESWEPQLVTYSQLLSVGEAIEYLRDLASHERRRAQDRMQTSARYEREATRLRDKFADLAETC